MATKPKSTTGPLGGLGAGVIAGVNTTPKPAAKPVATPKSSVPTMPPAMGTTVTPTSSVATTTPIKYATSKIYDQYGNLVEVYTEGPRVGYSVVDGSLVIQGEKPTLTSGGSNIADIMAGKGGGETTSQKYAGLIALLTSYGVDKIANMVDKVIADFPEADGEEVLNLLRYDSRYNTPYLARFSGNATRLKNKMPLLDEATYLAQELGYSKIFKSYGLKNMDNTDQYSKLIGSDISIDEAATRVSLAYDRVLKADQSTRDSFRKFFPMLSNQDLVAAMLDPNEQLPALERKVQSAEIGGAALRQGLTSELMDTTTKSAMYSNVQAGTVGAETLEAAGITASSSAIRSGAGAKYQTIAEELPTMEKLSSIYGTTLDQYGQREAEQADLLGLASAKRKKEALVAREQAQFQGGSGAVKGSLGASRQGSF